MKDEDKILKEVTNSEYKYGFVTDIESDKLAKGLNEDVIRLIKENSIPNDLIVIMGAGDINKVWTELIQTKSKNLCHKNLVT